MSECPNASQHTPCSEDYIGWHSWARQMSYGLKQRKCPECGLWKIWVSKGGRYLGTPVPPEGHRIECWVVPQATTRRQGQLPSGGRGQGEG